MRKRDRLFKLARTRQTDHDWARWRAQRNIVTSANRRLKKQHMRHKISILLENKKDPFKYHTILKSITGFKRDSSIPPLIAEDNIISDDRSKAEAFNSYFCAQTDINLTSTHHQHLQNYLNTHPETTHHLDRIELTSNEVLRVINSLDASKACGSDKLPTRLLKMAAIYIAEPLAKIFNKSLANGKYPTLWKKANVKPVFKGKGSASEIKNYRRLL